MNKKKKIGISKRSVISFVICLIALVIILVDGLNYTSGTYVKQLDWIRKAWAPLMFLSGSLAIDDIRRNKNKRVMILSIISLIPFAILLVIGIVLLSIAIYYSIIEYILPLF